MMKRVSEQTACENPKVSVHTVTYNHEKFIAQAIESVLMQETDFPVELVIGEDCSTDGTRKIVEQYAERYPAIIRPLFHDKNIGMHANIRLLTKRCRGEYIACLEGDDYWVEPHKLQKQSVLLEGHPNYSMCGSATRVVMAAPDGAEKEMAIWRPRAIKPYYELKDFIEDYQMHTSTLLLRKRLLAYPPSLGQDASADVFRCVLYAEKGPVGYLDEITSVYRMHGGGIWTGKSPIEKCRDTARTFGLMDAYLGGKYRRVLRRREGRISVALCRQLLESGKYRDAKAVYLESVARWGGYMPLALLGCGLRVYGGHRAASAWRLCDRFRMKAKVGTRLRKAMLFLGLRSSPNS